MVEQNINNALGFEETLNRGEAFFLKYRNAIIGCVAAVVIIVAGIILYKTYVVEPRENEASTSIAKGQDYFQSEQYELALNGDSTGYAGFIKIADEKSSTKAGNLASLYAGLCYANLGKWQEAADYLQKFDGSDDAMVTPAVIGALGDAYANLNDLDKAVSTWKKAAEKADNNALSPLYLIKAGEVLESQNKKDEALKLYQQIKDKYFESMQYQTIDQYIERVSE
ncbi:MAG: tetratricopeptide repeat protein [Prevotella sp.]|nr:tetratricopeptide repeat protein [Prevotella sp.]